jgi:hypothetical protein
MRFLLFSLVKLILDVSATGDLVCHSWVGYLLPLLPFLWSEMHCAHGIFGENKELRAIITFDGIQL